MTSLLADSFGKHLKPCKDRSTYATDIVEGLTDLNAALVRLEDTVMPEEVPTVSNLLEKFSEVSVKISLIGQVKAGKTALANALLGESELLPSDVNPWTSVVKSFHVNRAAPKGKKAVFRFFEKADWDNLVANGGRIFEMAR